MGRTIPCKLICYAAWILGGLMLMFFAAFFIGEGILGDEPLFRSALTPGQTLMYTSLGAALVGLLLAYFRPLAGGFLGVVGGLGFIYFNGAGFMALSVGWPWYMLMLAGILHLVAYALRSRELPIETEPGRVMTEPG